MSDYTLTTVGIATELLDLPLGEPLSDWEDPRIVQVPRGISRHVVRFVRAHNQIFAIKEASERYVVREHALLRELADRSVPVVEAFGTVIDRFGPDGEELGALLITKHLAFSLPYRSLFTGRTLPDLRTSLLDALAQLFVRLHLAGFYWGDCSLSNTLFRRDAGELAAYLVDAETGELHPTLTNGQRNYDLTIATENIAGELFDLQAAGWLAEEIDPIDTANELIPRYEGLWNELRSDSVVGAAESYLIDQRIRRLNGLGFDVAEMEIHTEEGGSKLRLETHVVESGHHQRRFFALTGLQVQPNQARRAAGRPGPVPGQVVRRRGPRDPRGPGRAALAGREVLRRACRRCRPGRGPSCPTPSCITRSSSTAGSCPRPRASTSAVRRPWSPTSRTCSTTCPTPRSPCSPRPRPKSCRSSPEPPSRPTARADGRPMRYDLSMSADSYTGEVSVGGPVDVRELADVTIAKLAVGEMNNNAYLIRCRASGDALLIDAAAEPDRLTELSSLGGPPVTQILTTHRHGDHWQGLAALVEETAATTLAGAPDVAGLPVHVTRPLAHGDVVAVGDIKLEIIALRGHTPGFGRRPLSGSSAGAHLFTGDSLFPGGVGRTANSADFTSLIDDVEQRVFDVLPDDTWVYPGHGNDTTLGVRASAPRRMAIPGLADSRRRDNPIRAHTGSPQANLVSHPIRFVTWVRRAATRARARDAYAPAPCRRRRPPPPTAGAWPGPASSAGTSWPCRAGASSTGTSTVRSTNASRAPPTPGRCRTRAITRWPPNTNDRNTQIMIVAAAVITRPVSACPTITARRLSRVCTHSSCIRETRKTW